MSKIPPPSGDLSERPDQYTSRDWTGPAADNRVLHINLPFLKYGTSDKAHAAAIVLSLVLLAVIIFLSFIGIFSHETSWLDKIFTWLGSTFVFVAGVAVGRSTSSPSED
jgi:hypothetical protein